MDCEEYYGTPVNVDKMSYYDLGQLAFSMLNDSIQKLENDFNKKKIKYD
jgi:hypothetical protein